VQTLGRHNGHDHHQEALAHRDEIPPGDANDEMVDIGKHVQKADGGIPGHQNVENLA
jgi:hypothetical protein